MKRFLLVLLGGLLLNAFAFAQIGGFTQRGKATQEMETEGFCAAHYSIPLDATVKIVNTVTGNEIEVTVTERIPQSSTRIVDLSFDAWEELELDPDTVITLSYSPPRVAPVNQPHETEEVVRYVEVETARPVSAQTSYHLLVVDRTYSALDSDIENLRGITSLYKYNHGRNGYIVSLYISAKGSPSLPVLPEGSRVILDLTALHKITLREYSNSREFRRYVTNRRVLAAIQRALEDTRIRVVPSLPGANSGKIYRLQVGAFSTQEAADRARQLLENAGLAAGSEQHGSLQRVFAADVRAADVYSAIQILGAVGFREVWVRE
jgi:hypothetical protein